MPCTCGGLRRAIGWGKAGARLIAGSSHAILPKKRAPHVHSSARLEVSCIWRAAEIPPAAATMHPEYILRTPDPSASRDADLWSRS
eukprot:scaffold8183_cov122-Isochrysis_galbana.AAC.11